MRVRMLGVLAGGDVAKIQIVGLLNGDPTPFDGQWLVEYDPTRRGVDPEGRPMTAHLVTTDQALHAKEFATIWEAEECWRQSFGLRKDRRPNRPLTAFIVEIQETRPERKVVVTHPAQRAKGLITFAAEFSYS